MVNKRSQTKVHMIYDIPRTGKSTETESSSVVARSQWEGRITLGHNCLMGMGFTWG